MTIKTNSDQANRYCYVQMSMLYVQAVSWECPKQDSQEAGLIK